MTEEEQELVVNNIDFVYRLISNYKRKFGNKVDFQELESKCLYALVKAAKTYDKNKNTKFSTYCHSVVYNEVLMYLRKIKLENNLVSIYTPVSDTEDLYLEDTLESGIDLEIICVDNEEVQNLYKFINELNDIDKQIMLYKLKGLTFSSIGSLLNLSKQRVHQRYVKSLNILRNKFKVKEGDI